jgi:hypothetical protein
MSTFFTPALPMRALTAGAFAAIALLAIALPARSNAQTLVPPQMRSEALALVQLCRADSERLCAGVVPGGGRILTCLQSQKSQLSPPCAQAMPRAEMLKNGAVAAGVLPK